MAKIVEAPIFHVNCNDPLSVIAAVETAFDYRQTFSSDVVIDMYCWRKHGHNESDEPAFTQPVLYKKISSMPKISQLLGDQLKAKGILSADELEEIRKDYIKRLETAHQKNSEDHSHVKDPFAESNASKQAPYSFDSLNTKVAQETLHHIVKKHAEFPEGFRVNRKSKGNSKLKSKPLSKIPALTGPLPNRSHSAVFYSKALPFGSAGKTQNVAPSVIDIPYSMTRKLVNATPTCSISAKIKPNFASIIHSFLKPRF